MSLLTRIQEQAERGRKSFRFGAYSAGTYGGLGFGNYYGGLLAGSQHDYVREAGEPLDNSIIAACIGKRINLYLQATEIVLRPDAKGKLQPLYTHPALDLLRKPNSYYPSVVLKGAIIASLDLFGNAYLYKIRNEVGRVVELIFLWPTHIGPAWPQDGSEWISHYVYTVDGKSEVLLKEDVIHLRDPLPDPQNKRIGRSKVRAILREVCTDNEAATFSAAILRNFGVPGLIVSPKSGTDPSQYPTQEEAIMMRDIITENYAGDRRGRTMVPSFPVDVTTLGFTPESLKIDALRDLPEERICAAFDLPPAFVGMGAGLQQVDQGVAEAAERWAWQNSIVPLCLTVDPQMSNGLMDEIPGARKGDVFGRDYTHVQAMKYDLSKDYARLTAAVGGPWLSPNDARRQVGEEPWGPEFDDPYENRSPVPTGQEGEDAEDRRLDPEQTGQAEQTREGRGGKKPEKALDIEEAARLVMRECGRAWREAG